MERELSLAVMLARQPGTKEARYDHLLSDQPREARASAVVAEPAPPPEAVGDSHDGERLSQLEHEVAELRGEVRALQQQLAEFRKQFE